MCPLMRAHCHHLTNTTELVLFSARLSPQPKRQIDRFSRFAQLTAKCRRACQGMSFPLTIAPSHGDLGPSNICFLGPTRVHNPNGISICSAVFAGLTGVTERSTDRPTDHATRSVTIGRICLRSTALRPNNNSNTNDNVYDAVIMARPLSSPG